MKKLLIGTLIGLVIGITAGYSLSANSHPKTATVAPSAPTIAQLLTLVNAERAKHSVAPLKEDARLDASAQFKAVDEAQRSYFGHIDPATGKNNGLDVANKLTGTDCKWVSENLTENTHVNDAPSAINAWIASPAHHAAMIDPKYSLTGFGIANDQIVEHFCQQ